MKKALISITILVAMVAVFTGSVFAAAADKITESPDINIIADGKHTVLKNVPITVNSEILLPLKELAVILGVPNDSRHIIYEPTGKSYTLLKDKTKIILYIGKPDAFVNGKAKKLTTNPMLYGKGIAYAPYKSIAEALGKKAIWDGTAKAIMICDAAKYNDVKGIMDKAAAELKKVKKYKLGIDISMDIRAQKINSNMGISADTSIDNAGKKLEMQMDMDILGMQMKSESYYADNASYTQNFFTGNWDKKTYSKSEYDKLFESQSSGDIFDSNDTLCAGLNRVQSKNANEILLKGEVFSNEIYENLMKQQNLAGGQGNAAKMEIDEFTIEISINKKTYLINSFIMKMKMTQTGAADASVDMTAKITYSEYNGKFEVTVPPDVLKNAVEIKEGELELPFQQSTSTQM